MLFTPAAFYVLGEKFSCFCHKYLKRFFFFFPSIVQKGMINPYKIHIKNLNQKTKSF